jgi:hypothetical protein
MECECFPHAQVNFFHVSRQHFAQRDASLVRHNDDLKPRLIEGRNGGEDSFQETDFAPPRNVFTVGGFVINNAITVKKGGFRGNGLVNEHLWRPCI